MKYRSIIVLGLALAVVGGRPCEARWLTAKEAKSPPRARVACLPNPTLGARYFGPDNLGPHVYGFGFGSGEHNGIVYTCRGGHVDVTHVRKAGDWAAYLAYHCRQRLLENRTQLSFKMREPSRYHLRFQYPPGWRRLPAEEREQIAREVSIGLGQYLGYVGSVWHEVLTWYGFRASGIYPEFQSAFSWEDNYSNAMGAWVGGLALRDPNRPFAEAMTFYIERELRDLGVQPKATARQAAKHVQGAWYTGGYFTCDMIRRHLDIGLDNGLVTPWLIPGLGDCNDTTAHPYPVPTLDSLSQYGFHVTVEIEPREWQKDKILRAAYPDEDDGETRIEPAKHFPAIMADINAAAVQKYGLHASEAGLLSKPSATPVTVMVEGTSSEREPGEDADRPVVGSPSTSAARRFDEGDS